MKKLALLAALLFATGVQAAPVTIEFELQAVSGSQFGVTPPAAFTGTFQVDSAFLANPDGPYGGSSVTDFFIQIGTQVFDQNTAYDPNIQGIVLQNNAIVSLGMSWSQTDAGLLGPYMQISGNGTWETGSTILQAGESILRGTVASFEVVQSTVPEPGSLALLAIALLAAAGVGRRKGKAAKVGRDTRPPLAA